jgi:hypothetical protein
MQFTVAVKPGGCYKYMGQGNGWGVEGTAVWAEDEVYDDLNHYKYQIESYAGSPHSSLVTEDFYQIYARVIWWKYFSENFGGRDAIYDLFHGVCRESLLESTNAILKDNDTDILKEYPNFTRGNLFLSETYEEGSIYPDFKIAMNISSYPDSYEPPSSQAAQLLGTNYIKLTPDGENDYLTIEFDGGDRVGGRPFDEWHIQIIAIKADKASGDYDLTMVLVDENGEGTASLEGFGTDYDQVYVAVSPLDDDPRSEQGSDYEITFDVSDGPTAGDDDDDEAGDDDDGWGDSSKSDDDDDDDGGSCGC